MSLVIEIREQLKKEGYNNRMVSVKDNPCGYSHSIDVEIKDPSVNFNKVNQIVSKHRHIRKDEYSGETLEGGNTYTEVEVSDQVRKIWAQKYLSELKEKIPALHEHSGDVVTIADRYDIWKSHMYIVVSDKINDSNFPLKYSENGLEYLAVDLYISDQN